MSKHVTIELDEEELARARAAAEARGVPLEEYLEQLVAAHLPPGVSPSRQRGLLEKIIGMGSTEHPTDIARDKDKLIAEAVWEEYQRETTRE